MIRVMCINSKTINHSNGTYSTGNGLEEGEIYTVTGNDTHTHPNNGKECYLIAEFKDLKLVSRFVRVLSNMDEVELLNQNESLATA